MEARIGAMDCTPAKTPPERWFGGYHQRENEASLLAKSYAALRIPPQNIRVFKGDLPASENKQDANPFHGLGLTTGRVEMWRGGGRLNISVCRLFRLAVP